MFKVVLIYLYKGGFMAKSNKVSNKDSISSQIIDSGAFLISIFFVWSVILNTQDLISSNIKNAPSTYSLIIALVLVGVSLFQRKKLNIWSAVTLAILATSSAIWLFGLSS